MSERDQQIVLEKLSEAPDDIVICAHYESGDYMGRRDELDNATFATDPHRPEDCQNEFQKSYLRTLIAHGDIEVLMPFEYKGSMFYPKR